ncbi:hypothetical protein LBW52_24230 [Ralstonia solanacearum]|uniref:hypothetical protein n=1 Tax=Ralstonia solanacearum TaxID=305 RepID=UPI00230591FE|nr:hypothetical protein [Ralstonia solanacearum]MDB0569103.1 hypothetical protein [Ralstonia solanacearum]
MDIITSWLNGDEHISSAIFFSALGFLAKSFYDTWTTSRRNKLERVNQQLKLLYGPLHSLNQSSASSWKAFREKVRPGKPFFGTTPPPNSAELEAWRLWVVIVFHPINETMCSIVEKNADLLIEDSFPRELELLLAHVSSYKTVIARWEKNDFSEHTSPLNYPTQELESYLYKSFRFLKKEQRNLIGQRDDSVITK